MTEMVANAARIANAVSIPLISDADTGYGNELNMFRTVQEFERAGVAAIHIEDQVFPKKCGHLDNKELVSREDFTAKIRAAAAARRSKDFCVVARTDSRAVAGLDEAVERANAALANGADVAFVEAPQTMEEVAAVPKLVKGPCLFNNVWRGKSPDVAHDEAQRLGYKITIVPGLLFKAVLGICDTTLKEMDACIESGVNSFKMFMAYPGVFYATDGEILLAMQQAARSGGTVMMHAENGIAIDQLVAQALASGRTDPVEHGLTRPPELEGEATSRAITLAKVANCPLYIVHL